MSYDTIKVLEELEHVRLRPGMYIGSTETPLHLCYEILDNALDEANNGHATQIDINISNDWISVSDNGRGIPQTDVDGVPAPIVLCTKLFSGGKFDSENYKLHIGLHGLGLTVVNALSKTMTLATVRFNKNVEPWGEWKAFVINFEQGKLVKTKRYDINGNSPISYNQGTEVSFTADPTIFKSTNLESCIKDIKRRVRLALVSIPSVKIYLNGELLRPYSSEELIDSTDIKCIEASLDRNFLIVGYSTRLSSEGGRYGAVNLLPVDKGTHINFARQVLLEAWKPLISGQRIEPKDVLIGSTLFIGVMVDDPQFTSQIKDSLTSSIPNSGKLFDSLVSQIRKYLSTNEKIASSLIQKFLDYRQSIDRLSSTNYLDSVIKLGTDDESSLRRTSIPKLTDCSSSSREETELFIVEGESAAGSLRAVRNPKFHAILPLRGKILNIIDKPIQQVLDNQETRSLINGIGAGAYSKTDISKIRYGKIIIMTDADHDGLNIRALIIGIFNYAMPHIIENGKLYYMEAPLFGTYNKNQFVPIYDESEVKSKNVQRFKGLGEMNANEIKEVAFSSTRRLVQVTNPSIEVTQLVGSSFSKKQLLIDSKLLEESW